MHDGRFGKLKRQAPHSQSWTYWGFLQLHPQIDFTDVKRPWQVPDPLITASMNDHSRGSLLPPFLMAALLWQDSSVVMFL
jgi:hypothetical protein